LPHVSAATKNGDAGEALAKSHASLRAYPNAVISLKDPKTENIFYVESNGRRLVALNKDAAVLWNVDVLNSSNKAPIVGQPVIRDLKLEKDRLKVVIGKHAYVEVRASDGVAQFLGSD
jgi:hypothetical protein